jgi:predicted RNA-binding protein with RPS1 domain
VLAVDPERERISLGVKQMEQDPFGQYMATNTKGSIVTGTVKEVDAKGATIELADGIEGYVAARDISKDRVEDASKVLKVGDEIEARFIGMDRKGRTMQLSIKAKDEAEMQEAVSDYNRASADAASGTTKLGALLREQLNSNKSESFPSLRRLIRATQWLRLLLSASCITSTARLRPGRTSFAPQISCVRIRPTSARIAHDQVRADRDPVPAPAPSEGRGRGSGSEGTAGDDGRLAGRRRAHRNPRFRQFLPALPSTPHGTQSQDG